MESAPSDLIHVKRATSRDDTLPGDPGAVRAALNEPTQRGETYAFRPICNIGAGGSDPRRPALRVRRIRLARRRQRDHHVVSRRRSCRDRRHRSQDRPFRPAATIRGSSFPCQCRSAGLQTLCTGAANFRNHARQEDKNGGNERILCQRFTRRCEGPLLLSRKFAWTGHRPAQFL